MSGNNGAQGVKEPETTLEGLIEAVLGGDISTNDLVETVFDGNMLEAGAADRAMAMYKKMAKKGNFPADDEEVEDDMEAAAEAGCPAPGSKIRSQGQGLGLARGRGRGPIGRPPLGLSDEDVEDNMNAAAEAGCATPGSKTRSGGRGRGLARGRGRGPIGRRASESEDEEVPIVAPDTAVTISSFESLVDEAVGLKPKKKKAKTKSKKKKMRDATESKKGGKRILEFAAPERQDVIVWARGKREPKRKVEGKTPFWFEGDTMISKNVAVARRDLEEKKAEVVHPRYLDAYTGRHAILANHGLRFCGYDVEIVDGL